MSAYVLHVVLLLPVECCNLCRCILPSTIGGPVVVVAVVVVVVSSILVVTNVAEYSSKDHRGNQDGVGDSKY